MSKEQEAVEIFVAAMDFNEGPYTDFRPVVLPADAPEEAKEEADPKVDSAPEPVDSSESPQEIEPTPTESPAPAPAAKDNSAPKAPSRGPSTSSST